MGNCSNNVANNDRVFLTLENTSMDSITFNSCDFTEIIEFALQKFKIDGALLFIRFPSNGLGEVRHTGYIKSDDELVIRPMKYYVLLTFKSLSNVDSLKWMVKDLAEDVGEIGGRVWREEEGITIAVEACSLNRERIEEFVQRLRAMTGIAIDAAEHLTIEERYGSVHSFQVVNYEDIVTCADDDLLMYDV